MLGQLKSALLNCGSFLSDVSKVRVQKWVKFKTTTTTTTTREWRGLSKGPDRNVLSKGCFQALHEPQSQKTEPQGGAARDLSSIPPSLVQSVLAA